MTTLSLGQRLAQNIAQHELNTRAAAELKARQESEAALAAFQEMSAFFERTKEFFIQGILDQKPLHKLRVQVGRSEPRASERDDQANVNIYTIIEGWNYKNEVPNSMQGKGRFAPLWQELCEWAQSEGLHVRWDYAHDGGGMYSWWYISIKPAAELTAKPLAAAAKASCNDVRTNHAYALHVLHGTLHGYMDALTALSAMQGHPRAEAHLRKFAALAQSSRQLYSDLSN